jgi:hypothetical protein
MNNIFLLQNNKQFQNNKNNKIKWITTYQISPFINES